MAIATHKTLWRQAWDSRNEHFPASIRFCRPSATLAVTVTGKVCGLRCAHCSGHYLSGMRSLDDPAVARAKSLLISGGCDAEGRVPVLPQLARISAVGAGKRLNWHVGLIDEETMQAIQPHVHVISFDFPGSDRTIHHVYGLERTVADYVATYRMLRRYATVVPHITAGVYGGQMDGEREALRLLRDLGAEALVFIVFIPTVGTRFAGCKPPAVEEVADLLAEARLLLPDTPIHLGCMRPVGDYRDRLDPIAVGVGVNKIVNPARTAVQAAHELGLAVEWGDECCVL